MRRVANRHRHTRGKGRVGALAEPNDDDDDDKRQTETITRRDDVPRKQTYPSTTESIDEAASEHHRHPEQMPKMAAIEIKVKHDRNIVSSALFQARGMNAQTQR